MARIQAAGPPRERRAAAQQARVELLITRHPGLVVTRSDSGQRVQLDGCVTGRVVRLTLRQSAREGTLERYVFKVALRTPPEQVSLGDLRLTPEFLARTAALPPTLTRDDHRWLRVGFLHLGKLDVLTALDGLITTAEHLDG